MNAGNLEHSFAEIAPQRRTGDTLHKSEMRYRRLFETAQDGILILDGATGAITDANPFILDLLGYPLEELFGRHLWEIGELKDVVASKAAFSVLQSREYVRYENLPLQSRSGELRKVEFISNVYDVEGEKVIQCNIREVNLRPDVPPREPVEPVGIKFPSSPGESVSAAISHELRAPVAAIFSMLDLLDLARDLGGKVTLPGEAEAFDKAAVENIRRHTLHLSRLTDELSDSTHLASKAIPLHFEIIDAHEAIAKVLATFQSQQELKSMTLDVRLHAWDYHLCVDSVKFHHILSNVIDNATKFTPPGGAIDVATFNTSAGRLVIVIHDTGLGMEAQDLSHIFSPFQQPDGFSHPEYGGLGLGLSIAKSLTEAHGGTLTAGSPGRNRGATFTLEFKTTLGIKTAPPSPRATEGNKATLRILLVQDDPEARERLQQVLGARGHSVKAASRLEEALTLLRAQEFDLLVTDIGLPDGDGWSLLQTARATRPAIELIAVSGDEMPAPFRDSQNADFIAHLVKPIDIPTLEEAIAKSARARRMAA